MSVIDRSGIVPVAVMNININDWKFVNDHFGDEESDRLIRTVAGFLKEEANWHIELSEECAKDKTLMNKLCEKI